MDKFTDDHQHDADHYYGLSDDRLFFEIPPETVACMVIVTDDDQPAGQSPYLRLATVSARRKAQGDGAGSILWLSEVERNDN